MNDDEILKQAKEHFEIANEAWNGYRHNATDTLKFLGGEQWDPQLKMNRDNAGLPSLVVNKLPAFLRQITNEVRQNTPSIQIDPKDDVASEETAEVLDGLLRTIQNESDADEAYDTAAYYAAAVGLGYFRVISEYEQDSDLQKLVIKSIDDPNTVLLDPTHRDAAAADVNFGFVITTISKEDYKRLYPNSKMSETVTVQGWTQSESIWVTEHDVLIAEYYFKDWEEKTLYTTFNLVTGKKTTSYDIDKELVRAGVLKIISDRKVQVPTIRWCKINDVEILEQTVWPGSFIPIIPVKGDEMWVGSKRILKGAVQDAIDSQRAFNYFFSLQAELVQLAPKTPFIGEIRQFANFEKLWRDANVAPNAYLPYNAVEVNGQVLPPPQRQSVEVPIQAAGSLCAQADDNLKSIFGIFDASLGANGNETSGKAILARQQQSHTTNYHFYDNLIRSITHLGRVMLEAVPVFYDSERLIQVTNAAGEKKPVMVNGVDPVTGELIDLTHGKFDVVVKTGASYATRREEAVESMMALGSQYPNALPAISDIMVNNMDWPGSKEIAARLRAMVPPEILAATESDGKMEPEEVVVALKQQLARVTEENKNHMQVGSQLAMELRIAKQENQLLKQDKSIEAGKAQLEHEIKSRDLDLKEASATMDYHVREIELKLQLEQLNLQKEELGLKAVKVSTDVASDMMHHAHKHEDRKEKDIVKEEKLSDIGNTDIEGMPNKDL